MHTPLTGRSFVDGAPTSGSAGTFTARAPATSTELAPVFHEADDDDVARAAAAARNAFAFTRAASQSARARLLEAVARELEALGDALVERAHEETGLPLARLHNERGRMLGQIRIFADMLNEGSWVGARIDRGDPKRTPLPKPDVRAILVPLGPVAVFGASNFPFAISVAGTDTVSALAAGCPVIVKGHAGHPGTSELVAGCFVRAVADCGWPAGTFALLQGAGHGLGLALVKHPDIKAVAFTGSLGGGRALFDAAAARPQPIPVFAEMGSLNPVFMLPDALQTRAENMAQAFIASLTMGVGQFCTNPGLVFGVAGPGWDAFRKACGDRAAEVQPATMLNEGILSAFTRGVASFAATPNVTPLATSRTAASRAATQAACSVFQTTADNFAQQEALKHEVFGPASLLVTCADGAQMVAQAQALEGHLTASVHGTPDDLDAHADLLEALQPKVGRLIVNGFGTGIEVCAAMNHGGPYPATTSPQFTSIGHAAIYRFVRPLALQGCPDKQLPPELQDANPLGIWRVVDGRLTREKL